MDIYFYFQIHFFQLDIMHSKKAVYSIYDVFIMSKFFLFGVIDNFNVTATNYVFLPQAAGTIITFLATVIQFHMLTLELNSKNLQS